MTSPHIFEVKVPEAGESVQEAMIESWLAEEGSQVSLDDPIVELETDKASMELVAEAAGTLKTLVKVGEMVKVGQVIATITQAKEGQDKTQGTPDTKNAKASAKEASADTQDTPISPPLPDAGSEAKAAIAATKATDNTVKSEGIKTGQDQDNQDKESASQPPQQKVITTAAIHGPAAQVLASKHGVHLDSVSPSAASGRVQKQDVLNHLKAASSTESTTSAASSTPSHRAHRQSEKQPLSMMRRRIAQRLLSATQNTAMLTTFNEVNMAEILAVRSRHKDAFLKHHGTKLGFMGFFIQASVLALKAFPKVNAYIDGDHMISHNYMDIGVAVATDKGLVVPVIQNAESRDIFELESALADLASRARDKKLQIHEMQGGTFTITNGGVFGSLLSTPIINPPQSAILGMHKIEQRPKVMTDGSIKAQPMMYLALSYDHRIVDGKDAVQFLVSVKNFLEDPIRLLLKV